MEKEYKQLENYNDNKEEEKPNLTDEELLQYHRIRSSGNMALMFEWAFALGGLKALKEQIKKFNL